MANNWEVLNRKILCGDDGEGVLITDVSFTEDTVFSTGETKFYFVVGGGPATSYLKNPRKPDDGVETLDEPLPCSERVDMETKDMKPFLDKLRRHFHLPADLVDSGEDVILRLVKGGDLYDKIAGKKVYFQLSVRMETVSDPKYGVKYYTNFASVPKTTDATTETASMVLAQLKAKRAAKEAAASESFGGSSLAI